MEHDQPTASEQTVPETAGSVLRRCREFQKISLEDAAEATKIGKNYLRALENDRPEDLPNQAYLKGFLRIYAAHLGLNAEDLLKLMDQTALATDRQPPREQVEERIEGRRGLWQRLLLPAFLLLTVLIASLFFMPGNQQSNVRTNSPIPPPPAETVQQPRSSAQQPVTPPPTADRPAAAPATLPQPPVAVASPNGVMIKMKVLKNGHLSVTIDDAAPQPYELTSGDLIEWKADRTITLDLSDAGGVELELNGKPLRLPNQPGKPTSLTLDTSGIKR